MEKEKKTVFQNKFIYYLILTGIFLSIIAKIFDLQVVRGAKYNYLSSANVIKQHTLFAPRGVIFDRNGDQVAFNQSSFSIWVDPNAMGDQEYEILEYLAGVVGVDKQPIIDEYEAKQLEGYREVMVLSGLDWEEGPYEISIHLSELPGVRIEESTSREYHNSKLYSQIIGYVGVVNESDVEQGKDLNDVVGKAGIEAVYDDQIRGVNGKRASEIDKFGHIVESFIPVEARPGASLVLTIDTAVQRKATEMLGAAISDMGAKGGAIVIEDIKTGEIIALVSLPTYDNNVFVNDARQDELGAIFSDPDVPLFNRAVSATYPPGSTFKTVTGSAGLEEGVISPGETIYTGGVFEYGGVEFQDAGKRNWGDVDIVSAYRVSSSIFFMKVALRLEQTLGQGIETIAKYAQNFGLGGKTGIDLPGESEGAISCPETKMEMHDEMWYQGDLLNASMGQGDHLVSPIQMVTLATAIANGGEVLKPHLVKEIDYGNGNKEIIGREVLRSGFVSNENLAVVREGMRATVTGSSGVGWKMRSDIVSIAVKTGTAESGRISGKPHAWIMGFAPYENPEIAFTFMVEEGGWSYEAAEYARPLIEWYYSEYKAANSR